jgi:hypothetical protein
VRAWVAHLLILAYLMYFALALNHNFAALIVHIISISTPKKNEVTRKFGMSFCRRPCVRLPARPLTWHHPIFTLAAPHPILSHFFYPNLHSIHVPPPPVVSGGHHHLP